MASVISITSFTITVPSLYSTSSSDKEIACGGDTCVALGKLVALPLETVE